MGSTVHRQILGESVRRAREDGAVNGLLLTGSWARGDASPGSDLDLCLLLAPGVSRPFKGEEMSGIWVERHCFSFQQALDDLGRRPTTLYRFLDGQICYDELGELQELTEAAQRAFSSFHVPQDQRRKIACWLVAVRRKLEAARQADDEARSSFLVQTNLWKLLEGLWTANEKPMPPSGAVFAHLADLEEPGPLLHDWLRALLAADIQRRVEAMLTVIEWLLPRLRE